LNSMSFIKTSLFGMLILLTACPGGTGSVDAGLAVPAEFVSSYLSAEPGPKMQIERSLASATLLADGRVFVHGGFKTKVSAQDYYAKASEMYEPAQNTFTRVLETQNGRVEHSAVLLSNGKVLIIGGRVCDDQQNCIESNKAELFNPATMKMEAGPVNNTNNSLWYSGTQAAALNDGKVMIVSPGRDSYFGGALVYDPLTNVAERPASWGNGSNEQSPKIKLIGYRLVTLKSGKVMVYGINSSRDPNQVVDPATGIFSYFFDLGCTDSISCRSPPVPALRFPNGKIMFASWGTLDDTWPMSYFDEATNKMAPLGYYKDAKGNNQSYVPTKEIIFGMGDIPGNNVLYSISASALLPSGKAVTGRNSGLWVTDPENTKLTYEKSISSTLAYSHAFSLKSGKVLLMGANLEKDTLLVSEK
jgi:hypothetical protein